MDINDVNWEELRANWVNGNISETRHFIERLTPPKLAKIVLEAVQNNYANGHSTGDLVDLIEILKNYLAYNN